MEYTNGATQIADLMSTWLKPSATPEESILAYVAEYSLQIRPDQHYVMNKLQMLSAHELIPEKEKRKIEMFIPAYQKTKRYHDTMMFITDAIGKMALYGMIKDKSINANLTNLKQT